MGSTDLQPGYIRPAMMRFAAEMERVLRANDYKGGWERMTDRQIASRILDEAKEADRAAVDLMVSHTPTQKHRAALLKEAVDVANFGMMLMDPDREENQ